MNNPFPQVRLRRLRPNDTIHNILAVPLPPPEKFIWPTFVVEGYGIKEPINSMPGQFCEAAAAMVIEFLATRIKL